MVAVSVGLLGQLRLLGFLLKAPWGERAPKGGRFLLLWRTGTPIQVTCLEARWFVFPPHSLASGSGCGPIRTTQASRCLPLFGLDKEGFRERRPGEAPDLGQPPGLLGCRKDCCCGAALERPAGGASELRGGPGTHRGARFVRVPPPRLGRRPRCLAGERLAGQAPAHRGPPCGCPAPGHSRPGLDSLLD